MGGQPLRLSQMRKRLRVVATSAGEAGRAQVQGEGGMSLQRTFDSRACLVHPLVGERDERQAEGRAEQEGQRDTHGPSIRPLAVYGCFAVKAR